MSVPTALLAAGILRNGTQVFIHMKTTGIGFFIAKGVDLTVGFGGHAGNFWARFQTKNLGTRKLKTRIN